MYAKCKTKRMKIKATGIPEVITKREHKFPAMGKWKQQTSK